jgi:hypothetical protein
MYTHVIQMIPFTDKDRSVNSKTSSPSPLDSKPLLSNSLPAQIDQENPRRRCWQNSKRWQRIKEGISENTEFHHHWKKLSLRYN